MKKLLALLLVVVMVVPSAIGALAVLAEEAPVYTDVLNLLPQSEAEIRINGGVPTYSLSDGKLALTVSPESPIAWPSIVYDVNKEVDLAETPYLHLDFETSGVGDRGVNGIIYYKVVGVDDASEVSKQLSDIAGRGADDFRDTSDLYLDFAKYLGITEKIVITRVQLSVYGGAGETIYWNALAFAKEGADEEDVPGTVKETIKVDGVLDDTGWNKAEWIENGHWQGNEAEYPGDDITGKYAVRADDKNLYIALELNTIAPHTTAAYNPDSFVQKDATDIRVWLKKDAETRTFFDLQYNGTNFTIANWNTTHDAVKDNIQSVVNYKDGKLVAEIAVPMANIGIEDSFYLLVSYCETFETGYNAIHFTTAEHLNNPDNPSDAYWAVTNTYSYTKYNVSALELGEYELEIPCEHEHVTSTTVKEATCTEAGYTEEVCADCGTLVSQTEIQALGHDYKDGVCTRCGEKDPNYTDPTPAGKIGDVDGNGVMDAYDYMMLKRHILGTFKLSEEGLALADVDKNGEVNSYDYMLLKRAILGTYTIADSNA